jgi:hypothetical protein
LHFLKLINLDNVLGIKQLFALMQSVISAAFWNSFPLRMYFFQWPKENIAGNSGCFSQIFSIS